MSPRVDRPSSPVSYRRTERIERTERRPEPKPTSDVTRRTESPTSAPTSSPTAETSQNALKKQQSDLSASYRQSTLNGRFTEGATLDQVAAGAALAQGQRGQGVADAQKLLNQKGAQPPLVEDGRYGANTARAVEAFKTKSGITDEAGLGPKTLAALQAAPDAANTEAIRPLAPGAKGDEVTQLQKKLNATGYTVTESGVYDAETEAAVKRLQKESGLAPTGAADVATQRKLAALAPTDGQKLERAPEYDKLYADGRLDTTMAIGYDEGGNHDKVIQETKDGLTQQGYRPLTHEQIQAMSPEQRAKLGLTPDRYDPNVEYFHKTFTDPKSGKEVDAVVRLITPHTGRSPEDAKASFEKALRQDELITYNGHGRYGTGPDFDAKSSGRGNVVIDPNNARSASRELRDSIKGRTNELNADGQAPEYQVLMFSSCNSDKYLDALRKKRSTGSTDAIVSSRPTSWSTGAPQTLRLLDGVTRRDSYDGMVRDMNRLESEQLRRQGDADADRAQNDTYVVNGALDNRDNRVVSVAP